MDSQNIPLQAFWGHNRIPTDHSDPVIRIHSNCRMALEPVGKRLMEKFLEVR